MEYYKIQSLLKESKVNARQMGQEKNIDFIVSTFKILADMNEEKSQDFLYNYLYEKFIKSDISDFNIFIEKELTTEDGVQIKSSIAQNNIPEQQPEEKRDELEEDYFIEEDEDGGDEEESSGSEEESSDDQESEEEINSFLEQIGLKSKDENGALVFLERFKSLIDDIIKEQEVKDLIVYLLFKAWKGELSEGETLELKDIIKQFDGSEVEEKNEEDEELSESILYEKEDKDSDAKTIGVISTIVASTLLFGVGGLLVSGLVASCSESSEDTFEKQKKQLNLQKTMMDLEKSKFDIEKQKIEFKNKLEKEAKELQDKNKKENPGPQTPNGSAEEIESNGESAKDSAVTNAKQKANKNKPQDSSQDSETNETSEEKPEENEQSSSEEEDEKNLDPQEFHKKYNKCPKGWNWDKEKNACVQVKKENKKKQKQSSIDYNILLF